MKFEYNGSVINYCVDGDGEAIVLLHGWGASANGIKCVAGMLNGMIISIDFPPFGESSEPNIAWTLEDYSNMTLECLRRCGKQTAIFIGHSFGGRVCIDIASRTNFAKSLVLIDAAGIKPRLTLKKAVRKFAFRIAKLLNLDTAKYYSTDYKSLSRGMKKTFSNIVGYDLCPKLASIKVNTLIVWGKNDIETPLYMAKKMKKRIHDSELIVLPGEHFCYLDNLRLVQQIIKAFIG